MKSYALSYVTNANRQQKKNNKTEHMQTRTHLSQNRRSMITSYQQLLWIRIFVFIFSQIIQWLVNHIDVTCIYGAAIKFAKRKLNGHTIDLNVFWFFFVFLSK